MEKMIESGVLKRYNHKLDCKIYTNVALLRHESKRSVLRFNRKPVSILCFQSILPALMLNKPFVVVLPLVDQYSFMYDLHAY